MDRFFPNYGTGYPEVFLGALRAFIDPDDHSGAHLFLEIAGDKVALSGNAAGIYPVLQHVGASHDTIHAHRSAVPGPARGRGVREDASD